MTGKIDEKVRAREARYDRERRVRVKWSEQTESLEEVFDRRTIMTVLHLLNSGKLKELHGVVKSGKESRVYHGLDSDSKEVAVKIYLTTSAVFRQGRLKYLQGDPRVKQIPHDTASLVQQWALKEFWNLRLAQEAGIAVPEPIHLEKNVLVLRFIGKEGVPAPLLREVGLSSPRNWYERIIEILKELYWKAGLVHGDISEYNIMIPDGYPVLIDFAQATKREHPESLEFLKRDIFNLNGYFETLHVKTTPFGSIFGELE